MLGGSWSTPVTIILLVMERSCIKGGSFSRTGSMGQDTEGDTSCLGSGVEFSLCEALCQPSVLLWQPCTAWKKGLAVVSPVLPAAAVVPHCLLPWQRTGQASLQWEPAAQESQGEVAMLATVSNVFLFCGQGQQLVQWPQSWLLCLGSVAGAGGKEEVGLPFILLGKCFLAMGSCQNYNTDSDALASKMSDGDMSSISWIFFGFDLKLLEGGGLLYY